MFAPMVKNVRDMADSLCALGRSQRKIVILRQFELLAKSADALHQLATVCREMAEGDGGKQQLRVPFRFEKGRMAFALNRAPVFVAVKNIRLRRSDGGARNLE